MKSGMKRLISTVFLTIFILASTTVLSASGTAEVQQPHNVNIMAVIDIPPEMRQELFETTMNTKMSAELEEIINMALWAEVSDEILEIFAQYPKFDGVYAGDFVMTSSANARVFVEEFVSLSLGPNVQPPATLFWRGFISGAEHQGTLSISRSNNLGAGRWSVWYAGWVHPTGNLLGTNYIN